MIHDPSAPVIVGAAAVNQHVDDPHQANDALTLMREALRRAAEDAGNPDLLAAATVLLVPQGTWVAANPAERIAPWNPAIRSIIADIGVLQQTLVSRACALVATGQAEIVLVAGGEAKFRALRALITGVSLDDPVTVGAPTERIVPNNEIITREEIERGLPVPARQYAMIDTALRAHDGWTPGQHIAHLGELQSGFSTVAAQNPEAWSRRIVVPSEVNDMPMVAWPYTKMHCSQWNVDQAAGVIVCSASAAERFGIAVDRRVFAHVGVESNLMVPMTRRAAIHRSPAVAVTAEAVRAHTGTDPSEIEHLELYSCFPAAVRVQAREMAIDIDRQLTVTGGMTFGGGPLNNATLQALVRIVHVLRDDPDSLGMVTNISGMLTKFGASVWSCTRPTSPYASVDVTDAATAATEVVDVEPDYRGRVEVITYTVAHDRGAPVQGMIVGRTEAGTHVVSATTDESIMYDMLGTDWCGRRVAVDGAVLAH